MRQLRDELDRKLAASAAPEPPDDQGEPDPDPLLGLWRAYADDMDEIVADAYRERGIESLMKDFIRHDRRLHGCEDC